MKLFKNTKMHLQNIQWTILTKKWFEKFEIFINNKKFIKKKALANEDLQKAASENILKGKKVSPKVQVKITQYIGESMSEESQEALSRIKEHLEKENETLAWRLMQLLRQLLPSNPLHQREQRALDDVRLEGMRFIHLIIFKQVFLKCVKIFWFVLLPLSLCMQLRR